MLEAIEGYLRSVGQIHRSGGGVKETSFYPPLAELLNEVGKGLSPKVRCIIHVKNVGAGIPDGGLFTAEQLLGVDDPGRLRESALAQPSPRSFAFTRKI